MTTTTQKTPKVNRFYARCATYDMVIDMDEQGLFCQVPSESDESKTYTVRVDESGVAPVATSCNCPSVKPCKHMQMIDRYYARIYKTNIAKHEAKQAAEAAKREAELAVKEAEKIVAPTYTNMFKRPTKWLSERIEKQENKREILAEAREIRERRQKMDYQSARTLDFFSNLPSRKELASPR